VAKATGDIRYGKKSTPVSYIYCCFFRGRSMPGECTPDYWFLGMDEEPKQKQKLLRGRDACWSGYVEKEDAWKPLKGKEEPLRRAYTSGNLVRPFVDGKDYMADLYRTLKELKKFEFALLAGWEFTPSQSLDDQQSTTLQTVLETLNKNRVEVRLLVFDNPIPGIGHDKFVKAINLSSFLVVSTVIAMI
jgi:hypothetical protein